MGINFVKKNSTKNIFFIGELREAEVYSLVLCREGYFLLPFNE
jgi:hypothetical protein